MLLSVFFLLVFCFICVKEEGNVNNSAPAVSSVSTENAACVVAPAGDNCSVCLVPLEGNVLATLPCGHCVDTGCLIKLVQNNLLTCPLCRKDIVKVEEENPGL